MTLVNTLAAAAQLIAQLTKDPKVNPGDAGIHSSFKLHKVSRHMAVGKAIDYGS